MKTPHVKQVRFWVWVNGDAVRLTLREGLPLFWWRGAPTDEGWEREETAWYLNRNFVSREHQTDGSDCDGRMTRYTSSHCHVCKLADRLFPTDIPFPQWEHGESSQRDYSAEAMNY